MGVRITKEEFSKIMQRLENQYLKTEEWIDKAEGVFPTISETLYDYDYRNILVDFIEDMMEDTKDRWVDYYLYEAKCKCFEIYNINNEPILIDSYDKLYDLIIGNLEVTS